MKKERRENGGSILAEVSLMVEKQNVKVNTMIYVYAPFARVTFVYAAFVRTTLRQVTFVRVTLVRVARKIKWVLVPDSRWFSYQPSVEQLFSDSDEEVTRRVNDEIK